MIDFETIKSRHRLEDVLIQRYQVQLRRAAGGWLAKCPIHGEQNGASFSVNDRKQIWFCHGRCSKGGDVLNLVMEMEGVKDAREAAEKLEGRPLTEQELAAARPAVHQRFQMVTERDLPSTDKVKFFLGTERHWEVVAKQRILAVSSIQRAQEAGVLRFCERVKFEKLESGGWKRWSLPAWAVMDVENPCNVQFRRFDVDENGKALLWPWSGQKVDGLKGNWAQWPVGLSVALKEPEAVLMLVEGAGDFLAAWDIRDQGIGTVPIVPVAMFGASQSIHPGALPLFAGRDVIIVQQHDAAGEKAVQRWHQQLSAATARPRVWQVPEEGADLNDYIAAGGDAAAVS